MEKHFVMEIFQYLVKNKIVLRNEFECFNFYFNLILIPVNY